MPNSQSVKQAKRLILESNELIDNIHQIDSFLDEDDDDYEDSKEEKLSEFLERLEELDEELEECQKEIFEPYYDALVEAHTVLTDDIIPQLEEYKDEYDDYGQTSIIERANAYLESNYKSFLASMVEAGICKQYNYNARVDLEIDIEDYLDEDIEKFYFGTHEDLSKIEKALQLLEEHYDDLSEIAGSIANAHSHITLDHLTFTKQFVENILLIYQAQSARSKIQQVLDDPEAELEDDENDSEREWELIRRHGQDIRKHSAENTRRLQVLLDGLK